jgi:hypothetical protein
LTTHTSPALVSIPLMRAGFGSKLAWLADRDQEIVLVALTSPQDPSFRYELAGRLESSGHLNSDPQFGRR